MTKNKNNNQIKQEISLLELWGIFRNHILSIILTGVLVGIAGFGYSQYLITPLYTSSVTLYVEGNNKYAQGYADSTAQAEYSYTTDVINTYIEILKTESFFEEVGRSSNNKYTFEELQKNISIQQVKGTEIIQISVTTEEAIDSYNIAMRFAYKSSGKIESIKSEHRVKIVDPAIVENLPSNDRTPINTVIGMVLGIMISYIFHLLNFMLDQKIKGPDDITTKFTYPVLGVIPNFITERGSARQSLKGQKLEQKTVEISKEKTFAVNEAYKTLRSSINFSITHKGCKTILITSALPKEGKTTTCVYLTQAILQTESKVLLIDADLRNPKLHTYFNITNGKGLSDVAAGMSISDEVIIQTELPQLQIITAGAKAPNPSELLNSENVKVMLKKLKMRYDYIIIDTPPIGIVSDAYGISKDVDGFLIIAKSGKTEWPVLKELIRHLEFIKGKVLGFTLTNFTEQKTGKYGYKYQYKYRNKY